MVAVTKGSTYRPEYCIQIISGLHTQHRAVVEKLLCLVRLLTSSYTEQCIMIGTDALLQLKLGGSELLADIFHMANAGKRHLLFHIMAEPLTTKSVAKYDRNHRSKKHTAIDHRLNGEAVPKGERHTPIDIHVAHTRFLAL